MTDTEPTLRASRLAAVARRWPIAVGLLAAAAFVLAGPLRPVDVAVGVVIAVSAYLAGVASGRPWMAWVWCAVGSALVVVARLTDVSPVLVNGLAALVLVVVGVGRGVARPALARQTAGLVIYGGLVLMALTLPATPGLVLAAMTLAAHGIWDVWHLRRHRGDVSPSLAQACVALDVPAGMGLLVLAVVL